MKLRDTFKVLKRIFCNGSRYESEDDIDDTAWNMPYGIPLVYLMTLIRLSDYLHIDHDRTSETMIKLNTFYSKYSLNEHISHLAIKKIHFNDKEVTRVYASPEDAEMHVKIENLVNDIQKEFDLSWAILGELYSNNYNLSYRRIKPIYSNFKRRYVPQQFSFRFNNELSKLLIAPLYGDNPSYAVRELVQNAVDACRMRMAIDSKRYNNQDRAHINVTLNTQTNSFKIEDTGIGMTLDEIEKYFLVIGSSYNKTTEWQKTRDEYNVYRTGRFGIGVLAAFLIGPEIRVRTKSIKDQQQGYEFVASLDKKFIQINMISEIDFGTTIEIKCDKDRVHVLEEDAQLRISNRGRVTKKCWFDWYVDIEPRVDYYLNNSLIPIQKDLFKDYLELQHTVDHFGKVLWKPLRVFEFEECERNKKLFCNGFLITEKSNKTDFYNRDVFEGFYDFEIPSLYVSDVLNQLHLNLQRNGIDKYEAYPFENDLALAMYNDYLCQLLAIDVLNFKWKDRLLFNSNGFTFNRGSKYPFFHDVRESTEYGRRGNNYKEICLKDKTIVHICQMETFRSIDFNSWISFFNELPNVFFSFYDFSYDSFSTEERFLSDLLNRSSNGPFIQDIFLNNTIAVVNDWRTRKMIKEMETSLEYYTPGTQKLFRGIKESTPLNQYYIVANNHNLMHRKIAEKIIAFLNYKVMKGFPVLPLFFLIHEVESYSSESKNNPLLTDRKSQDMLIPYDTKNRKDKYQKLYSECSDQIEKYRKEYEQNRYFK